MDDDSLESTIDRGEDEFDEISSVSGTRRDREGLPFLAKVIMGVILLGMVLFTFYYITSLFAKDKAAAIERSEVSIGNALPRKTFELSIPKPKIEVGEQERVIPIRPVAPIVVREEREAPPVVATVEPPPPPKPILNRTASSLMVLNSPNEATEETETKTAAPNKLVDEEPSLPSELEASLVSTKTEKAYAGILRNRSFILAKGAYVGCVLKTEINSSVPGMTSCTVTKDIYSDNGRTLLIEKGSEISGEYNTRLRRGVARIFVLWNRIKTPFGVVVDLDSPAAGKLGAAGIEGHIKSHFWQRFGAAMMLSLVDDVASSVAQQNNSGTINLNSTSQSSNDMASIALENSINIPPTISIAHGKKVGVYIARDIDFTPVYETVNSSGYFNSGESYYRNYGE